MPVFGAPAPDDQERTLRVGINIQHVCMMTPQGLFDDHSRAISKTDPNHFRRRPIEKAQLMKILVFRDHCEAIDTRVFPDRTVVGFVQLDVSGRR